ncbi:MAG: hypothetical protein PHQ19_02680 [Candidatus Krumholzibacteria bacterium]|nr:hypothetical protein [Candidatus Krumholzibacteria bacterium]
MLKPAIMVALASALSGAPVQGQESTNMFIVYGSVYADTNQTIAGDRYIVTVEIMTAENAARTIPITTQTGTGADQGKYCAVFIATGASPVAMATDAILVRARKEGESLDNYYGEETLGPGDIIAKRKRIDFIEGQIAVEFNSWGAIKSLFGT